MKRIAITIATVGFAGLSYLKAQTAAPPETPKTATGAVPEAAATNKNKESGNEEAKKAWTSDYGAARKKAIAEEKDLLIVFTGSEWIELCQFYDRDILYQPDFIAGISEHFVPVRLDYPKGNQASSPDGTRKQLMMRAYRIVAFPTLVLTDAEGRPYAINGYQPLTPAESAKVVDAMRQTRIVRDDLFNKAAAAEGVEKATLLAKAIPKLPGSLAARFYRPELEEILALDPKNETGKVPICRKLIADADYSNEMERLKREVEWSKMIELTDNYIAEQQLAGAELQQAMLNKVGVYRDQANTPEMIKTLLEIVKIDEKTPQGEKAQKVLDGMRARVLQERLVPK